MSEIFIGLAANGEREGLALSRANRHGLIAGATGTGKTVTLQGLAEGFSAAGVPVFLADVKGDLSGVAMAGSPTFAHADALIARAKALGMSDYAYADNPAVFWDLYGQQGHPIRTTISEMGPLLLARLLDLNETQEGVLNAIFRYADEQGLLLLDLEDLQAMLAYAAEHAQELSANYGNVTRATVGTIQRQLLTLDSQGGAQFFGEPALEIADFIRCDEQGRGIVSILAADKLMQTPRLYATFLLWLLAELFEQLPEVGDPEKPKLVFFFDEAHLLFNNSPAALIEKIEQVVRLIRSKGVGVYFVTQNPLDIPESVLGQLGNRVQHALRAFTPKDQKAVRAAAQTFRANPAFDTEKVVAELGVGEALVSVLDDKGAPTPVERVLIRPPESRLGPLDAAERSELMARSPLKGRYETAVDRESAYEKLKARAQAASASAATEAARQPGADAPRAPRQRESIIEATTKSAMRAIGSSLGRQIVRGVLGSIFGGRR